MSCHKPSRSETHKANSTKVLGPLVPLLFPTDIPYFLRFIIHCLDLGFERNHINDSLINRKDSSREQNNTIIFSRLIKPVQNVVYINTCKQLSFLIQTQESEILPQLLPSLGSPRTPHMQVCYWLCETLHGALSSLMPKREADLRDKEGRVKSYVYSAMKL